MGVVNDYGYDIGRLWEALGDNLGVNERIGQNCRPFLMGLRNYGAPTIIAPSRQIRVIYDWHIPYP